MQFSKHSLFMPTRCRFIIESGRILKDENDNMVFECAANYNADFLVTHNIKDFRGADLAPYRFDIITPQQFLQKVLYDRTPN